MGCNTCGSKKKAITKNSQAPSSASMSGSGSGAKFQSYITSIEGQQFRVTGKKKVKR